MRRFYAFAILGLLSLCCFRASAQAHCSVSTFMDIQPPAAEAYNITPSFTNDRVTRDFCGIRVIVKWGANAGDIYFFYSTKPDCSVMDGRFSTTAYGVPSSVQEFIRQPFINQAMLLPGNEFVCISFSVTPISANTEVNYVP